MSENLIDELTKAIFAADQHQGYGAITEVCAHNFAEISLNIMQSHLATKLATILESQERMMESFLFQQKMISSLIPLK